MSRLADSLAGAALRLAKAGWFVLALQKDGKAPAITRGVKNATRDPVQIEHWWRRGEFNVGIAAGAASGVTIVDIDSLEAADSLARTAAALGGMPRTVASRTPRGYHIYFRHEPELRNRVRVAELNVDVRNDDGYAVAPPSRLSVNERYYWVRSPWTTPLSTMPSWLSEKLGASAPRTASVQTHSRSVAPPSRYGQGALRREADQLSRAAVGGRNHALNTSAFRMGSLMEACDLSEEEITKRLLAACEVNGLVKDDGLSAVHRTITSGLQAGRVKPRHISESSR